LDEKGHQRQVFPGYETWQASGSLPRNNGAKYNEKLLYKTEFYLEFKRFFSQNFHKIENNLIFEQVTKDLGHRDFKYFNPKIFY
jgi:hypothetical protein